VNELHLRVECGVIDRFAKAASVRVEQLRPAAVRAQSGCKEAIFLALLQNHRAGTVAKENGSRAVFFIENL
jgi:hypothetical protein